VSVEISKNNAELDTMCNPDAAPDQKSQPACIESTPSGASTTEEVSVPWFMKRQTSYEPLKNVKRHYKPVSPLALHSSDAECDVLYENKGPSTPTVSTILSQFALKRITERSDKYDLLGASKDLPDYSSAIEQSENLSDNSKKIVTKRLRSLLDDSNNNTPEKTSSLSDLTDLSDVLGESKHLFASSNKSTRRRRTSSLTDIHKLSMELDLKDLK